MQPLAVTQKRGVAIQSTRTIVRFTTLCSHRHSTRLLSIKVPDYYSHSFLFFFFQDRLEATKFLFTLFTSTNTWETHLSYRKGSPLSVELFKRNTQNQMRLKGPPLNFFRCCETFFRNFCLQRVPFDFLFELSAISELLTLYPNYIAFL